MDGGRFSDFICRLFKLSGKFVMLRKILLFLVLAVSGSVASGGPYAPPVGEPNCTAIHTDDPNFVAWATAATIERGYVDISAPSKGYASHGVPEDAIGEAEGDIFSVVSLGDGGAATLTFEYAIANGPGYDFAVFENAFNDTFLELAYVEVSSDGTNFFGFDSVSLTQMDTQIDNSGSVDTTDIHNLAGKYRCGYGTPFDLEELADVNSLLDVNCVTHVRVIDVVGCIQLADFNADGIVNFSDYSIFAAAYLSEQGDENWNQQCDIYDPADDVIDMLDFLWFVDEWLADYARYDSQGHQINDPWPTDFPTGGFDLDAVGVINEKTVVE